MNFTILSFDQIGSTNSEAINQASRGADEGLCIVARQQTAGRGRKGRVWVSPKDAGLYLSVVLRPRFELRFWPLITLMTAVAVHDVLEELYKIECDIKWANDVHTGGKKICGVLAETCETTKGGTVVVGLGINLKSANFPEELGSLATSVEAETGIRPDAAALLENLTRLFALGYAQLHEADGAEKTRQAWSERSSYSSGKLVKVVLENETICGATRGIEENGALRIELDRGEIRIIHAGDVENLRDI